MKTRFLLGALAVAMMAAAPVAFAQSDSMKYDVDDRPVVYHPRFGHASTQAEGFLTGWAKMWSGVGSYVYDVSRAMINREIARSQYIDNRLKAVQTYFDVQKINRQERAAKRSPSLTQEQKDAWAKTRIPKPLSQRHYDPISGKIYWPVVFEHAVFDMHRRQIEDAMAQRSYQNSGLGSENHMIVWRVTNEMRPLLREFMHEIPTSEWIYAKKFLDSLEYESRNVLEVGGGAYHTGG